MEKIVAGFITLFVSSLFVPVAVRLPKLLSDAGNDPIFGFLFILVVLGFVGLGIIGIGLGMNEIAQGTLRGWKRPARKRGRSKAGF